MEEITEIVEELNPITELQKIKENYIPKEEYARVLKEKNEYWKALINGDTLTEQKPEITPEQKWESCCEVIRNKNKYSNRQIAEALVDGDNYYREHYGKSIFTSEEGALSDGEEKVADKAVGALNYSLENSEDNETFTNFFISSLK